MTPINFWPANMATRLDPIGQTSVRLHPRVREGASSREESLSDEQLPRGVIGFAGDSREADL
jgi:hypothetical protein